MHDPFRELQSSLVTATEGVGALSDLQFYTPIIPNLEGL